MLKQENISDKLADAIGKKIIFDELKSGEIITETQISKEWEISRSPVREAFNILKTQWLLESSSKGLHMVPVLDTVYVKNFHDTTNMFFQYTIERAAKYISDKDSAFLLSVVEKILKSIEYDDIDVYLDGVAAFANKALQIARNPIIEKNARDLMPTAARIQFAAYEIEPSYLKEAAIHIRKLYEYFSIKDSHKAIKSYKLYTNTSRKVLAKHLKGNSVSKKS